MKFTDNCPVEATLDLIGGKYKALILWHLSEGKLRFSELRKVITTATPKMLTQQLRQLETYLFRLLRNMVDEIASGCVEPNPYTRGTSHNACSFCPYGAVCHQQTVAGRRNYKAMTAQRFWEEIEKEVGGNG